MTTKTPVKGQASKQRFTLSEYPDAFLSQFCEKPNGTATSAHEFKIDWASIAKVFAFEYGTATCKGCGAKMKATRSAAS